MEKYGENTLSFIRRMIQSWTTRKAIHKTTLIPFTSESAHRTGFTIPATAGFALKLFSLAHSPDLGGITTTADGIVL